MTSPAPSGAPASLTAKPAFRKRRYLVDRRFQLKYTSMLVGIVLVVVIALGVVLWRMSESAANLAQLATNQAEVALRESQAASRIVRMNERQQIREMTEDDPEAAQLMNALFEDETEDADRAATRNVGAVRRQRAELEDQRWVMLALLIGGGAGLTVLLTLMGIYITHRIVGPVVRLKRMLRRAGTSRLEVNERLRKNDELHELFDTFLQMTYSLRELQLGEIATLDMVIARAEETKSSPEVLEGLHALRTQMCLGIGRRVPIERRSVPGERRMPSERPPPPAMETKTEVRK